MKDSLLNLRKSDLIITFCINPFNFIPDNDSMFFLKSDDNINDVITITESDRVNIEKLAKYYSPSGEKYLDFDQFVGFMKAAIGLQFYDNISEDMPEVGTVNILFLQYLFRGIDLNQPEKLPISDICTCYIAIKEKNYEWLAKIVFRGCDIERKRKIDSSEVHNAIQDPNNNGKNAYNHLQFLKRCREIIGHMAQDLTYPEFYQLVTNEIMNKEVDPYDGEIKKSNCCLIL